ncbi:MAG: porin family protein [Bacteroidota bacterium]|nr:porin family protein [Bacteroidota bacterium]
MKKLVMMKKLLLLLALALFSIQVFSQRLQFGVFADPQVSWMSPDVSQVHNDTPKIGINFGFFADKYFAENYAFTTGLSINSVGGSLKYDNAFNLRLTGDNTHSIKEGSTVEYKLQYLCIPFGLKFKTRRIGYFTYFAKLGVTSQFNIKALADSPANGLDNENVRGAVNFLYMGYHIGIGTEYSLGGNTALTGGITYTNGFTNVTSGSAGKTDLNYLAVRLGVLF